MIPRVLSCTASDWQNSLRNMLGQKADVDLTNVNPEFDGVYLEEVAKENGMSVIQDENLRAAFFRQKSIKF